MNKQIKKRWLKALRSGRYQQTEGKLKDGDGYCCLGVLASINGDLNKANCQIKNRIKMDDDRRDSMIPNGYCGIHIQSASKLARLNDSGESFAQIADYIEKKL